MSRMGAEMGIEAMKQIRIVSYEQLMDRTEKGRFVFVNKWDVCVQCDSFEEAKQLKETLAIAEAEKQPQRQWVGLTDQEIDRLNFVSVEGCQCSQGYIDGIAEFAKAIEAKLREKNGC